MVTIVTDKEIQAWISQQEIFVDLQMAKLQTLIDLCKPAKNFTWKRNARDVFQVRAYMSYVLQHSVWSTLAN